MRHSDFPGTVPNVGPVWQGCSAFHRWIVGVRRRCRAPIWVSMARQAGTVHVEKCRDFRSLGSQVSVNLRTYVVSLLLDKLMCDMGLRRWLATLTRRKPFGTTVPRLAKHPSEPVFSAKKWLKTPDIWRFSRAGPVPLGTQSRRAGIVPANVLTRAVPHRTTLQSRAAMRLLRSLPPDLPGLSSRHPRGSRRFANQELPPTGLVDDSHFPTIRRDSSLISTRSKGIGHTNSKRQRGMQQFRCGKEEGPSLTLRVGIRCK